jgi:ElaB/YqjD/DUF883 family membrane-anchored ribosome-binding protein
MAIETKATGNESMQRSDHQKTGGHTGFIEDGKTSSVTRRDFGDKVSDLADDVKDKAKEAGDTFMEKAGDVKHSMQDAGHNIAEKSRHTHEAIVHFTRDNPTAAVLMAFGLGAILARILPGR